MLRNSVNLSLSTTSSINNKNVEEDNCNGSSLCHNVSLMKDLVQLTQR